MPPLRSRTVTHGRNMAGARALLRATGVAREDIGKPIVAGAKVTGEIVEQGRGDKLVVFKFRRRKNYVRKNGHRQSYTAVKIAAIEG